jgi:hypothetical protein
MIRYNQMRDQVGLEDDENDEEGGTKVLTAEDFKKPDGPRPPFIPKPYGSTGGYR